MQFGTSTTTYPSVAPNFCQRAICRLAYDQQYHRRRQQYSSSITSMKMMVILVPCLFLSYQSCVGVDALDYRKPTSLIRGSNPTYSSEHHTASALATEKVDVDDTSSYGHSEEEWFLSPSERRSLVSFLCCVAVITFHAYVFFIHSLTSGDDKSSSLRLSKIKEETVH